MEPTLTVATPTATPPPEDAAPVAPPPPAWRPARESTAPDKAAIEISNGNGTDVGHAIAQVRLAYPVPHGGLVLPHPYAAVEEGLTSAFRASSARSRFRSISAQLAAATKRQAVATATIGKLAADRKLAEAQAAPQLGVRLAKLTTDAATATGELEAAEVEIKELQPLHQGAYDALVREVLSAAPGLIRAATTKILEERTAARAAALQHLADGAGEALTAYVRIEQTIKRYFMTAALRDWTPLVQKLITADPDQADAPASTDAAPAVE